jgi:catechol 2,3-dioxygenase-like lactoylglutathione lyase family enzyme
MFTRISAVVLFVEDFEKCLIFYRDTLELPVAQLEAKFVAFQMNGHDFALQELEQSANMVSLKVDAFEPQTGKTDRVMLCARVDDIDATYAKLKAKGVTFTREPIDQYWGLRAAYFTDPEGNLWELAQQITD